MKKTYTSSKESTDTKKGYNEKNPGEPQGAFPPASGKHKPKKEDIKSNAADKKAKEDS
jgi:hypothetical protein